MIIAFNLDGTICNKIKDYKSEKGIIEAKPREHIIRVMHELQEMGIKILILTKRSSIYCEQKTMQWLRNNDVPYHEVKFDMPDTDLVVEENGIPPFTYTSAHYLHAYAKAIKKWSFEKGSQSLND